MNVRFQVDHADWDPARGVVRLVGTVLEGDVRPGMTVTAGPVRRPSFREAIHAVEPVDGEAGPPRIALVFPYQQDAERDRWMTMPWHAATLVIPAAPLLHPCPCCGFRTLRDAVRGGFEWCGVCAWEDDPVQLADPAYRGGANGESLREARAAFFGTHPHLRGLLAPADGGPAPLTPLHRADA